MSVAHEFIDAQGESRRLLVTLDGRCKLLLLTAALTVNLTAGGVKVPLLLALLGLILVLLSGVRVRSYLRRMAVPVLLATVAFLTQLFWFQEGEVLTTFALFGGEFSVYSGAVLRGLEIASRIVGGMSILLFFSLTTPLPEMMRAARYFRCPPVLVELTLIMYRYIFLLFEEGVKIRNAQRSRLGYVGLRTGLRSSATLGGMLLLRTYDRAERSFAAMRCRGYRGALTTSVPEAMRRRDWLALFFGGLILLGLYALR